MRALWPILLSIVLALPVWGPYLDRRLDLWPLDDAENHLIRLYTLDHLLAQGLLWPRWLPDLFHGFGQPIPNFYAPLFYYLAAWTHRLTHLGLFASVQVVGASIVCLGTGGVALLLYRLTDDRRASVFGAVVYAYSPYPFLTNLYYRGALPEALALGLLPWATLGFVEAARPQPHRLWWAALGVVAAGACILSHNMLGPVAIAVGAGFGGCVALALPTYRSTARSLVCLAGLAAATLGLTAFFTVPVVREQGLVRLADVITKDHEDIEKWLIDPLGTTEVSREPGYPYTQRGLLDLYPLHHYESGRPMKIPWAQVLPLALFLPALISWLGTALKRGRRPPPPPGSHAVVAVSIAAAGLVAGSWWLTTTWSKPVWDHLAVLRQIQFTYRLYGPLSFGIAVLAGCGAYRIRLPSVSRSAVLVTLGGLLALNALGSRDPRSTPGVSHTVDSALLRSFDKQAGYMGTTAREEYMPRTVQINVFSATDQRVGLFDTLYPESSWLAGYVLPYAGNVTVHSISAGGLEIHAGVDGGAAGGSIALHQLDFSGWITYVDGATVAHRSMPFRDDVQATLGFIVVDVPPGPHTVTASFEATPVQMLAEGAAALAAVLCLLLLACGTREAVPRAHPRGIWQQARLALLLAGAAGIGVFAALRIGGEWRRQSHEGPPHVSLTRALIADLSTAAAAGHAKIESPSGPALGPERFVDVRWLQVGPTQQDGAHGGALRRWLYLHPPSRVSYEVDVPPHAWLQTGLALDPSTWATEEGDGVRFIVEAQLQAAAGAGPMAVLLDRHLNPRAKTEERGWNDVVVDLSAYAGRRIIVTLRTDPADNLAFDWAGWGNPAVVTRPSARWG